MTRADQPRLPFSAITSRIYRDGIYKTCLHPEAASGACGKVISAHTLQRSRVLKAIADDSNHVLTFFPPQSDDAGHFILQRKGWRQASTFDAFCDYHDTAAFAALENQPFSATKEQIFLIAYRAMCWELYRKVFAIRSGPGVQDLLDRGAHPLVQRHIQHLLQVQNFGFQKGRDDLEYAKKIMDNALIARDYSMFDALEILMEGPISIASTGAITPNLSIAGEQLQILHDTTSRTQWLSFGTDVKMPGVSVVFLWFRDDPAPRRYVEDFMSLSDSELPEFMAQFFFAHCENTYFDPSWWQSLEPHQQQYMIDLMSNWNPYYYPPAYNFTLAVAPWRLISRAFV